MAQMRLNDREREQWVMNDEGLYRDYLAWTCHNKGGMRGFIRAYRNELDRVINAALNRESEN